MPLTIMKMETGSMGMDGQSTKYDEGWPATGH